jgi:predicted metal-dependent enzyme (double-stranded beta helix superfamily)
VSAESQISVREYARQLIDILDQPRDTQKFRDGVVDAMTKLLKRPDLLVLGIDRLANHQPWSAFLYYDGQLSVVMSRIAMSQAVPVHDHGVVWEAIAVYRGSVNHRLYRRLDDNVDDGRQAKLELVEDAVLEFGDTRSLEPPADIHGLQALEEDTYIVGAHLGEFPVNRHYYQPDRGTYIIRNQQVWKGSPR